MKIAYITVQIPFGKCETFLIPEMCEIIRQANELTIVPFRPARDIYHEDGRILEKSTIHTGVVSAEIIAIFCRWMMHRPLVVMKVISDLLRQTRTLKIAMKNLSTIPKAFYCADVFERLDIQHIHAHWGSRTSTLAWLVSQVTGIPWSLTLHRWDIYENNLLRKKAESALFVRCICNNGKKELLSIIGDIYAEKIRVIHMGVDIQSSSESCLEKDEINIEGEKPLVCVVPANLIPVKGHQYMIEAIQHLVKDGAGNIKCYFYGDGPLKSVLASEIADRGLSQYIELGGRLSHDKLLNLYMLGRVDAVVLPSVNDEAGNHEGIPVSLMEAMAYGIPVISTDTGSISELVGENEGIIVEEKNSYALAVALERLISDKELRRSLSVKGREKIEKYFSLPLTVSRMTQLMSANE